MQISKKIGLIISPKLLTPAERKSICNPCCIKVPDWKIKKLGKYYLYFADHRGKFIKMAYSNNISKDWKIYKKKILKVNQFQDAKHHIASPEIYLDNKKKIFYMLTHSYSKKIKNGQWTYLSSSVNGITFNKVYNVPLAPFYLRIFKHKNYFFGISKGGNLWKSKSLFKKFKACQNLLNKNLSNEIEHNDKRSIRHLGIIKIKKKIFCFYTKIGDAPERIYFTNFDLKKNWKKWKFSKPYELLRPTLRYEGSFIKPKKSKAGTPDGPENAVRDPYVVRSKGKFYLFYCVKGEKGIAVAEIS